MNKLNRWLPPAFLALLAFSVRLSFSGYDRTVWGDEPYYLWLGRNWFQHGDYSFAFTGHWDYHHTPGYPFLTAILTPLTGSMQRASEWNHILFGVLLTLAIYGLAQRIYGRKSAIAAGAITALAPATALMPLFWGTMTETPYLALAYSGLYFGHRAYRRFSAPDILLAGLFLGLAYYIRPEGIVYLGVLGLLLGFRALAEPPRLRRLAYPALLGLTFILVLSPYLLRVQQVTGSIMVSQKVGAHFATAQGLSEGSNTRFDQETWGLDSTGLEVRFFSQETANASALDYILSDPANYARVLYSNTRKLLALLISARLLPLFALPFIALALFRRPWDRPRAWDEGFLAMTLLPGLSFILFLILERYIVALIPTLFIWFGHGLAESGDWLSATVRNLLPERSASRRWTRPLVWLPTFALILFLLAWTPRQAANAYTGGTRPTHNLAAAALAPHIQPGDIVMSRYAAIAFHAGADWVPTPAADVPAVLTFAAHKNADFWAIDAEEARSLRPQFLPLLDSPAQAPPELEYLDIIDDGSGPVLLYRILP